MARGISIHIGVNHAAAMSGYPLSHCEEAAWRMAEVASQAGYHAIHVLRGAEATRDAVGALLDGATRSLRAGQTLFVSFSGHGSREPDVNGDEWDQWDETWCLHDGNLVDDALAEYWRLPVRGARVLVVAETCYAGGGMRGGPSARNAGTEAARNPPVPGLVKQAARPASSCITRSPLNHDDIRASLLLLAAASEDRRAKDGVYTRHLLEVWNRGAFRGSFCELHRELCCRVGDEAPEQEPQILMLGEPDDRFPLKVAFHLNLPVMRGRREDP